MNDFISAAYRTLQARVLAAKARCYKRVFDLEGGHARETDRVLADLKRFCRVDQSIFDTDALHMARLAGRREVALRIFGFLHLKDDQVDRLVEVESDYTGE